jgi:hypothetical protein
MYGWVGLHNFLKVNKNPIYGVHSAEKKMTHSSKYDWMARDTPKLKYLGLKIQDAECPSALHL